MTNLQQSYIDIELKRNNLKEERWAIESKIIEESSPFQIGNIVSLVDKPELGTFEIFDINLLYFREFGFKYFLDLGNNDLDTDVNAQIHYDRMDECLEGKYIEDLVVVNGR